ncbi:Glycogen synthase [uncultured archaeon]|nr:Glycogen synthase [uncultured archaeon]
MADADAVFEVSYEVCNKVGGIYAVLTSKAAHMVSTYGDKYYAVGFYDPHNAKLEFDEQDTPPEFKEAFYQLKEKGVVCRFGRWTIKSRPQVILVDAKELMGDKEKIKTRLWETHHIDSLYSDNTFVEPVVWSTAVGLLLDELTKTAFKGKRVVAQFHEWMSSAGMLQLTYAKKPVATVFTTHATMLGRTLSASGIDIYEMIRSGKTEDPLVLAKKYGVIDKHTMEAASAKAADVFTTVSEITGREAEAFLGRKPDVLLLNGIDSQKYPEFEELAVLRRHYRKNMKDFFASYFLRYYDVDMTHVRSFYISGRYEFHNKGIDLFIESLGRLNERMKKEGTKFSDGTCTIVALFFIPSDTIGENIEVLKNNSLYQDMQDQVEAALPEIRDTVLNQLSHGKMPQNILTDEFIGQCRKLINHFTERRGGRPPLCAFQLAYPEANDAIIQAFIKNGLLNRAEDKVKVIYYPAYLSSAQRLISMDYQQATLTFDVGVFPSSYEPWGYTPLEAAAQSTMAVTTDLAGYGLFVDGKSKGIYVLRRWGREWDEVVDDLTSYLYRISSLTKKEITELRADAKNISSLADWKILISNYIDAHDKALISMSARTKK